jgi:large subunit ribosomal protein L30
MSDKKQLTVTLKKSIAGRLQSHQQCVKGLGLRRLHHTVVVEDTPATRGMIDAINYLVEVKEA